MKLVYIKLQAIANFNYSIIESATLCMYASLSIKFQFKNYKRELRVTIRGKNLSDNDDMISIVFNIQFVSGHE